jgi:hypothetical protein
MSEPSVPTVEKVIAKHKAAKSVKCYTVRLTVSLAKQIIEHFNVRNRPVTQGLVKAYANELLRGQWRENGEPFIFGVNPETEREDLISGQHRALALVRAQACIDKGEEWPDAQLEYDCVFVTGVNTDAADTVDTGKSRNHTDVLFRDSWVDSVIGEWNDSVNARKAWVKTLAGAARLVWIMQGGATVSHAPKFNTTEMLQFVKEQHPRLSEFVTMVLNCDAKDSGNGGLKMSLPYIAAICYASALEVNKKGETVIDKDVKSLLQDFIAAVANGTNLVKGSAAWALTAYWNKLTSEPGSKDRDRDWAGPFIKALNAHFDGATDLKATSLALTKKERENYAAFPPFASAWHQSCFEHAASVKAAAAEQGNATAVTESEPRAVAPAEPVESDDFAPAEPVKPAKRKASKPAAAAPEKTPKPKRTPKAPAQIDADDLVDDDANWD